MRAAMDSGAALSSRDAGRACGLKKERVVELMNLLRLAPDLQDEIAAGKAALSINAALRTARLSDPQAQREAFERERRKGSGARRVPRPAQTQSPGASAQPVRVRAVVCFNPEAFVEQRCNADALLVAVYGVVRELNERLQSPRSRQSREGVYAEVDRELRRRNLVDAFEILVHEQRHDSRAGFRAEVQLRPHAWRRRRRYDGFLLLVAHPDSLQDAGALAQLFRAKDAVEKDFQTIKSVVELRPVRHRTDAKVRAHVTLCMLALLLERTLEHRLAGTPSAMTAPAALEMLSNAHLNRLRAAESETPVYTVTRTTEDQRAILQALGLQRLADDEEVADRITAR